jgi:hypothetical protein
VKVFGVLARPMVRVELSGKEVDRSDGDPDIGVYQPIAGVSALFAHTMGPSSRN